MITRGGAQPHKVVLSFDDGPDPQYTPEILDALHEAGVPATFFITGVNGELHPELLRREIEEGHEIGNHTVLGLARMGFIGALAIYQRWRSRRARFDPAYAPSVAVVVPAYNEEKVIVQTIASLLASEHPARFEIIVVDDGSTDATYRRVGEAFAGNAAVRVFTRPNGGKSAALNFGVAQTRAEIVVALDADTLFRRDALAKLIRHFADPRVGAVAGNAKVGNRINVLTRWQALEYITSQNLDRRAFDVLNCITVVPGAVGAWRRELIEQAGGFSDLTLAEDADLTLAIRKLGYRVVYEEAAVALTEAPDTVRGFLRQRYRWMYGHPAGGLQACRCAVAAALWRAGLRGASQHRDLPGALSPDLAGDGSAARGLARHGGLQPLAAPS